MNRLSDPYKEKFASFFPREIYFWVLHSLGWLVTLRLMNHRDTFLLILDEGQLPFLWLYLLFTWFTYYLIGTFTVLLFRRFYYQQRWYEKKMMGSLPLVLLAAIAGGATIALLVHLPLKLMQEGPYLIFSESGDIVFSGLFSTTLYSTFELSVLLILWLLAYLGVEGAVNARRLTDRAIALENNLKDARLNALSGQINPHFLFNALNNIRFMIQKESDRAEESLVALSEILRHSLGSTNQEKVPLSQELSIVERYMRLMKNQMRDRLDYSIQENEVSGNCLLPPMIIQMLAENAVKHGVEQVKAGGSIRIECSSFEDKLHIEVRNTAPVLNVVKMQDKAEQKQNVVNIKEDDCGSHQGGLGLINITNRLLLLYGEDADLITSQVGDEFIVFIELPTEIGPVQRDMRRINDEEV